MPDLSQRCLAQLDTPFGQQNAEEFAWLLGYVKGARSLLEIGSSFGHSLRGFSKVLAPGAVIRSIDLGYDGESPWRTEASLRQTIRDLRAVGFNAKVNFADSHLASTVTWAKQSGPYDFIFIDGDHSYKGVKADWRAYGPLGRTVAFHDIELVEGVHRLWHEIEASGAVTAKCIKPDPPWKRMLGIGVVLNA